MQKRLYGARERSENLRMVTYFHGWYSLCFYAGVCASVFVVIIHLGTGFQFVLFVWEFHLCVTVFCLDFHSVG